MNKFKDKLIQFMYGRYGTDPLYYALLVVSLILLILNYTINSPIITGLLWLILIVSFYRSMSKNISRRRQENDLFLKFWNPVKAHFKLTVRRIKEIKTRRFRKCPNCKAVLRLPIKKGKHTVSCPCCDKEFEVRILF